MSKFINKKGLILMISTILVGSSVVAIAAACNNKTSQPSKQKQTNTQQSSSSTTKTTTKKEDKMNSGSTNNNPSSSNSSSSSKTSEETKNNSSTNKTNDKTGSAPTVSEKPTTPKAQNPSNTQGGSTFGSTNDVKRTQDGESEAVVTIYGGTKITKESENRYLLQINIKNVNDKYAQVVLKAKDGTGSEIVSQPGKIFTSLAAVYFANIETKKEYNISEVRILDSSASKTYKTAALSTEDKGKVVKYEGEQKAF